MVEEDPDLPLPDETFSNVWSELDGNNLLLPGMFEEVLDDINLNTSICEETCKLGAEDCLVVEKVGELSASIKVPQIEPSSSVNYIPHHPSSLPGSQDWPGEYGFNVSFGPEVKNMKGAAWTYSKIKDKLYVGKDAPCPISFSTTTVMPDDAYIRAMALYSAPDQVSEIVQRCVNHSMEEISKGVFEAEHLIRCDSSMATYHVNKVTGRHSVIVPFENPAVGQQFSTYIFKFACFGSCSGGPNRRPLMVIFTLERKNKVIGRKKLNVKICACPTRDRKSEEQQCGETVMNTSLKKDSSDHGSLLDAFQFTGAVSFPPPEKKKAVPNKDGYYKVSVDNPSCYEFLKQMKEFYCLCKEMHNVSPSIHRFLLQYLKMKSEEKRDD